MRKARLLLIGSALFALSACSVVEPRLDLPVEGEAAQRWQAFSDSANLEAAPSVLDGSLRFGPENETSRVTYTLWSNGSGPVRLDIQAGVGTIAARVQVADGGILIFMPQDGNAYYGTDSPDQALRVLGLPLPLSVEQLTMFLLGNYSAALAYPTAGSYSLLADGYEYALGSGRGRSTLRLDEQGRPTAWNIPGAWKVAVSYDEVGGLPRRIDASRLDEDYDVVLIIRSRQDVPVFAEADLNLLLPQNANVYLLDLEIK